MKFNLWEDCDKVPLTELLSFVVDNRGKTVPTVPSGHKLIATNCVTNNTLFPVYEKIRYLSEETYQTWFRAHPIPGDILFVNKGTPGRVCLVPDPVDFCIAQDMIALRADESKVYPKYLFAVLRSREIQQQIYNTNVGDVIPHFKKQFLDQLMIPIPERSIQESIGDLYYVLSLKAERNKMIDCSPLKEKSSEIRNIVDMALLLSKSYLKSRMFDKTLCAVWPELIFTLCKSNDLFIKVGDEKFTSVNVAISSLKMSDDNFRLAHMKRPNRSYDRYQKIALLVNTALKESANLLVMPEACTPLEWLPVLARTSSRNNMAIITGVEHIFSGTNVYNLTAVILPYTDRKTGAQGAHIFYHSKNHFAPGELQLIRGNILQPFEGNGSSKNQSSYELYNWNDFLFSVYCCYELTSIADRSIFQSFADAIIAVEWNHDVNYYSNIIESLSRDVHCYCIQVNTSDYGDSRITQPTKTEKKDILRTKGGANAAVLVGKIEIAKLREFQAKTYELQKDDSTYKPTPPNFNSRIAYQKSTGQLSADIIKELFTPKSLLASHPFGAVKYS